ncbi:MAG: T9SS type A sorting domain-containing protein [Bacteroidetes bacterium]|nr:MAG: T9SS type A sorting domain-containing protein [Bacteroidota bacterium]
MRYLLLFLLIPLIEIFPQERYVVSPTNEVTHLRERNQYKEPRHKSISGHPSSTPSCSSYLYDGYPEVYLISGGLNVKPGEAAAMWFEAKYTGSIDTIFFSITASSIESAYVSIYKANVNDTSGPGHAPYPSPCTPWGYYYDNFLNQPSPYPVIPNGTWVSTVGGDSASYPLFGIELWGGICSITSGYVVMADLPTPVNVVAGDFFFITIQPYYHGSLPDARIEFRFTQLNEVAPSRIWKYYDELDGPSDSCGPSPVPIGWIARNLSDPGTSAAFNWWYSISPTANVPPELISTNGQLGTTISNEPRHVLVELEDCDYSNPSQAGVTEGYISYSTLNNVTGTVSSGTVTLINTGGNTWEADIPGQPAWTTVTYSITAIDTMGLEAIFLQDSYFIAGLENDFFLTEVNDSCTPVNIRTTGTEIPSSAFFAPPDENILNPKDDGTAGPFALGGPFYLFGEEYYYAWVGVNGAMALSKTAAETLDVNANGYYTTGFTFPDNSLPDNNARDSADDGYFPTPFIAGFWNDLFYGETIGSPNPPQWGHILHKSEGCNFIVQWDTIAVRTRNGDNFIDQIQFRILLNKCNGTISFQYDDVGMAGLDTTVLVGVQADSTEALNAVPWILVNTRGGPLETKPQNGRCITLYQTNPSYVCDKWNMVPVYPMLDDSNYSIHNLFPGATSKAFEYTTGGYVPFDTVLAGHCYWVKSNACKIVGEAGPIVTSLSIDVLAGWNLIGGISCKIATASVDDAIVAGASWFGYGWGYYQVTTLMPGQCYWVKATDAGTIHLDCYTATAEMTKQEPFENEFKNFNTFTISTHSGGEQTLYLGEKEQLKNTLAAYELPPLPLQGVFDARFASQRMVEVFTEENSGYTIKFQSPSYPVQIAWDVASTNGRTLTLKHGSGDKLHSVVMRGKGSISITDPNVTGVKIEVSGEQLLPEKFELMQNYPNPFNPVTTIRYSLPVPTYVTLKVYDILGREVATLVDGMQDAGFKMQEWDAKEFPSGVYLSRLSTEIFTDEKRMVIIK